MRITVKVEVNNSWAEAKLTTPNACDKVLQYGSVCVQADRQG